MKFNDLFKRTIRNFTLQNTFLLFMIIFLWISGIIIIENISEKVKESSENYYKYLIGSHKNLIISSFNNGNLHYGSDTDKDIFLLKKDNISREDAGLYEQINNLFGVKNTEEVFDFISGQIYYVISYNDIYIVEKMSPDFFSENVVKGTYASFISENGEVFYSDIYKNNIQAKDIKYFKIINGRIYLNKTDKYLNFYFVNSIDYTLPVVLFIVITLITVFIVVWNIISKSKTFNDFIVFNNEFEDTIKSVEILLSQLKLIDTQDISALPSINFENLAEILRYKKYKFNGLEELKDLEELVIKEFVELLENLGASYEEITSSNDELENLYRELEKTYSKVEDSYINFSKKLSVIAEKYDDITGNHIERVAEIAHFIAKKQGIKGKLLDEIRNFTPLHDIGKLLVKRNILDKPSGLTPEEYKEMQNHTIYAADMLGDDQEFFTAKNIALYHHEKYDGSGYPFGLKENDIPVEARIVSVADVYDSLRSERPYKRGYSHEESYDIITCGDIKTKPEHFDPKILELFKKYNREIEEIYKNASGQN